MRMFILIITLVLMIFSNAYTATIPFQISGNDWISGQIQNVELDKASKGTVIVFVSAACPCSSSHEVSLKKIYDEFSQKGFQFLAIHSNKNESDELAKKHFTQESFHFPVIRDIQNKLADSFEALKTPHAFVFSPKGDLLFQGGVDDSRDHSKAKKYFLQEVLTAIDQGRELPYKEARTLGCTITR